MSIYDEIEAFKRGALESRLARLTDTERAGFWRLLPSSPTTAQIQADRLVMLIELCDRTISRRALSEVSA